MPPRQRTNSIADGQSRAITCASWPAPDGSRIGVWPSSPRSPRQARPARPARNARWRSRGTVSIEKNRPRVPAMRFASVSNACSAASRSVVGQRAQVDGERHASPGMMLTAPGDASMRPTVPTMPSSGCSFAIALQRERHLGGAGKRVVAQRHRHRAGVAGLAGHRDAHAALPDDAGDDAERLVLRLQHRPLLDMDLDIAGDLRALVGSGGYRQAFLP